MRKKEERETCRSGVGQGREGMGWGWVVKIQNEIPEIRSRGFVLYGTDAAKSAMTSTYAVVSNHPRVKAGFKLQAITVLFAELNGVKMATQMAKGGSKKKIAIVTDSQKAQANSCLHGRSLGAVAENLVLFISLPGRRRTTKN